MVDNNQERESKMNEREGPSAKDLLSSKSSKKAEGHKQDVGIVSVFIISFLMGILASMITVYLYTTQISPAPHYYTFNLNKIIKQEEKRVFANKNINMTTEISTYMRNIKNFIDGYAKHGIVFVGGATVGNSPYVTDITQEFEQKYAKE